jgi:hypothetical protein
MPDSGWLTVPVRTAAELAPQAPGRRTTALKESTVLPNRAYVPVEQDGRPRSPDPPVPDPAGDADRCIGAGGTDVVERCETTTSVP